MNKYTVVVRGKDENTDHVFQSDISLQSNDIAWKYASDVVLKRIQNCFVGNWWVDSIYNHTTGKRVLLRDE